MVRKPLTIEQGLTILTGTSSRFIALTTGLTPDLLRSGADGWSGCMEVIITQGRPIIQAIDRQTSIK